MVAARRAGGGSAVPALARLVRLDAAGAWGIVVPRTALDGVTIGSILIGLAAFVGTIVLAARGEAIPDVLKLADTSAISVFLVASAVRGTTPPSAGSGGGDAEPK